MSSMRVAMLHLTPKCLCDHILVVALLSRAAHCKRTHLTSKVLLSPVGTIWTLGRLVQFQFMLRFFEIFMEDVVFYKLRVHIIFSKIGHSGKKL